MVSKVFVALCPSTLAESFAQVPELLFLVATKRQSFDALCKRHNGWVSGLCIFKGLLELPVQDTALGVPALRPAVHLCIVSFARLCGFGRLFPRQGFTRS